MRMAEAKKEGLAESLASRIEHRTARVCIVGLGYVGLPLAETFAAGGYPVLGFDIDEKKDQSLQQGKRYIGHISSERVAELIKNGLVDATSDSRRLAEVDAVGVCVA